MEFSLSGEELENYNKWLKDHNKVCPFKNGTSQGAIGGRLTFNFTPTSLGTVCGVKCACGEEKDLTVYDW